MVQANAALNRGIYYQNHNDVYVCQYFHSELTTEINGENVRIHQSQDHMSGSMLNSSNTAGQQELNEVTALHENLPNYKKYDFVVHTGSAQAFALHLRIPDWILSEAVIYVNDQLHGKSADHSAFYTLLRNWRDGDRVSIILPVGIRFIPLPDDEQTGAFRFGPEVLAGICENERILFTQLDDVASELIMENEREWGSWRYFFKTANQDPGIQLRRIRDIGYEPYQVYFTVKKA